MKKTAVLFVVVTTLVFAGIFTGCSSYEAGSSSQSSSSGKIDSSVQSSSSVKVDSSTPTDSQDTGKIPDTNDSAVSDWGVAETPKNTHSVEAGSSTVKTDLSKVIVDRNDLYFVFL